MSYTVGDTEILESPGLVIDPARENVVIFTRTLKIGPGKESLLARLAPTGTAVALVGAGAAASLREKEGFILLHLPPRTSALTLEVLLSDGDPATLARYARKAIAPPSLDPLVKGGPRRWPVVLKTRLPRGRDEGAFAVDKLVLPEKNPWRCQMRLTGFDFLPDGQRAAVCSWDGDVWLVSGLQDSSGKS